MNKSFLARSLHKWLGLVVGLQVLIWLLSGFIHQVALDNYLASHPNINDCEFYICGPPAMLMATLEMLAELGVNPDAIRYDDFGN